MICKHCGSECPDGNIFCEVCGKELDPAVLPENIDSKGRINNDKTEKKKKPAREKVHLTEGQKAARKKTLRWLGIGAGVVVIVVALMLVISFISSSNGYSTAVKISLGRNIEYAKSETGLDFAEKSSNGMINSMADFDYIYASEDKTRVNGSEYPKWIILLNTDNEGMISDVEFYDFTQLKNNWMGKKTAAQLTENDLTFGMSIKNVNKTIGMKPYYIKRSVSNDSVYCYRYYCTDPDEGYDRAFNYYVDFSETEKTVRTIHYNEIEYSRIILNVGLED
ncbi:MAG: zinc ribbon domain-containing protein, partial [Oscillospiraceae bacterium]|nr:zinc ribbon domain-containing protein [Oscillospiraceae bacterium]